MGKLLGMFSDDNNSTTKQINKSKNHIRQSSD